MMYEDNSRYYGYSMDINDRHSVSTSSNYDVNKSSESSNKSDESPCMALEISTRTNSYLLDNVKCGIEMDTILGDNLRDVKYKRVGRYISIEDPHMKEKRIFDLFSIYDEIAPIKNERKNRSFIQKIKDIFVRK